ncbi:MAG: hypothetical protein K6E16_09425 [Lachnospiraceae bacterium]|nr:hypothetical protein [Lachnospiraceae bacterium]
MTDLDQSEDNTISKKRKPIGIIIACVAGFVILVAIVVILVLSGGDKNKYEEKLALAERYLNELDYDKAIATYKEAIEIDPKRKDAYEGIVNVYLTKAEAAGDDEQALVILDEAVAELERLDREYNDMGVIESYRLQVLTAQAKYQRLEPTAKKEEAEDENTVTPTEATSEEDVVTPTEGITPTERITPTAEEEPDEMIEEKEHSNEEQILRLVLDHYEYKYFGNVGTYDTGNGKYRINGNLMNVTLMYVVWDEIEQQPVPTEIVEVTVNMDTGLCTDDKGESAFLW